MDREQPTAFDTSLLIEKAVEKATAYADRLIASLEQQIKAKDEQITDKNHIIKLLEQKVEILEAMQHIDAENPLRSPFPVGVAEQKEQKESLRV